jgi:hypothetical protein
MQSCEVDLGQVLVEHLALCLSKLKLLLGWLSGSISTSESSSTPWRTTADFREVDELAEGLCVTERNEYEAVVGEGAHHGDGSGFLSSSQGCGGDEETSVLSEEAAVLPLATSLVPEGLYVLVIVIWMRYVMSLPSTVLACCRIGLGYRRGSHRMPLWYKY